MKKFLKIKKATIGMALCVLFVSMTAGSFYTAEASSNIDKQNNARAKALYPQCVEKFDSNDIKGAAACFMQADEYAKKEPLYKILAGDSLKILKQYSSAVRYYEDAINNAAKNKKMKDKVKQKAYIGLAESYAEINNKEKALEYADKSIREYGKDYRGHYIKGFVLQKDNPSEAIEEYKKSLEVDKKQYNSYVKLIRLYKDKGDIGNAINTYKEAIDYRPLDEDMKMAFANLYISETQKEGSNVNYYPQAIEVLKSLTSVNNQNAQAHYFLSTLYLLQGDKENCYKELDLTNALNTGLGNRLSKEITAYLKKQINEKQA